MKNLLLFLTVSISFLTLTACTKVNDDDLNTVPTPTNVTQTVQTGDWRVTYYWDTDHDATSYFSNYTFSFMADGSLTATYGSTTMTGTWSAGTDDSQTKLYLSFLVSEIFQEISEDWHVIERTSTKIRLEDVSGGNGGTDYLTFEKI